MTLTHKQRVLLLLLDGNWHSHHEGYRLGVMLHSRVADLRRDGYQIECRRNGDLYEYRLTTLEQVTVAPPPVACSSVPAGHAARDFPSDRDGDGAAGTLQLQIEATPCP